MARSIRQSKIIEIINKVEIDTQDELVSALKEAGFNVTQATISRDIKELGLFKVAGEKKKYRYAVVENESKGIINKVTEIFRQVVLSITPIQSQIVIKTIRGTTGVVANLIERLAMTNVLGCICGDDLVLVITQNEESASQVEARLREILESK